MDDVNDMSVTSYVLVASLVKCLLNKGALNAQDVRWLVADAKANTNDLHKAGVTAIIDRTFSSFV